MLNLIKFKKDQRKHNIKIVIFVTLILLVVLAWYISNIFDSVRTAIDRQFITVKYFANRIIEIPNILSEYVDVKKENELLKIKLDNLKLRINAMNKVKFELDELKKSINLNYSISNYKHIEKVLGFDLTPYNSFMIITANNKYTTEGKIVISSDGLVGIIKDCNEKFARVMTILDQRINIPVKSKNERLIIFGEDGKLISKEIKENSKLSKLVPSDILYTSGDGGFFPANIPVAKISNVNKKTSVVSADPLSDIANISYVWIISPTKEN